MRWCQGVMSTISSLVGALMVTEVRSTSLRSWRSTGISTKAATRLVINSTGKRLTVMATKTTSAKP
jgi:hypothetical protein